MKYIQEIQFHTNPIPIKYKLHIVKNILENNEEYTKQFNKVLEELKVKQIDFKVAITEEDYALTGYNVLIA